MKTSKKLFMLAVLSLAGMSAVGFKDTTTTVNAEENQLLNGGFEEDLTGWTGDNIGDIKDDSHTFWGNRTFNNNGKFLCGEVNESLTGKLVSSSFVMGGEGYVSALLGGSKENYIAVVDDETGAEVVRLVNDSFADPVPARQWNMIYVYRQVGAEFINKSMHIEIVDTTTSGFGAIIVDDIKVSLTAEDVIKDFYSERDRMSALNNISANSALEWYDSVELPFLGSANNLITNPDFEDGFNGWSYINGEGLNENPVREATHFWGEDIPFNNHGQKLFCGWDATENEALSYGIKSSTFTLGGSGVISFKMGGRNALAKVVLENGMVVTSYKNTEYNSSNFPRPEEGNRQGTMVTFVADLSNYVGLEMHLEFYDSDTQGDWGVLFVDDIRTYYYVAPTVRSLSNMVVQNYGDGEYSNNAILIPSVKAQDVNNSNLHNFLTKYYGYLNNNSICDVINNESEYNDLMNLYNSLSEEEKLIADNRPSLEVVIKDTLNYMASVSEFSNDSQVQEMTKLTSLGNQKSVMALVAIMFVALIPVAVYTFIKKRKNSI